jgi:cytosine/adenosine deaminase-related metal-dependent hydrolase
VDELGQSILLPGLINAHTHLSLTGLAGRKPPGTPYLEWLAAITRAAAAMTEEEVAASVRSGLEESHRLGTALVGEITTRPEATSEIVADGRTRARVFFEFLGVTRERIERRFEDACARALDLLNAPGDSVLPGLSPHAPYSVWPTYWERAARFSREHRLPWATHLAESGFEEEFLKRGTGPLLDHLVALGVWDGSFPIPGVSGAELLEAHDALDDLALVVHGIHLSSADIRKLTRRRVSVCLCPRSNAYLDLPPAPGRALFESGVTLCLGTDSKASNDDLGVWGEMRLFRRLVPRVPARALVEMATVNGARALGFGHRMGSIQPGVASSLIAVEAGSLGNGDPHEFLVREPMEDRLRWVPEETRADDSRPGP